MQWISRNGAMAVQVHLSGGDGMSAMKTFVNWLGLGPDEGEPYAGHLGAPPREAMSADPYAAHAGDRYPAGYRYPGPSGVEPRAMPEGSALTPLDPPDLVTAEPLSGSAPVRPRSSGGAVRPIVVCPAVFDEAQEIGDQFKRRQPVIVNLQDADSDLRRRLVDFAAGLCYALDGQVERVTRGVYLLTPSDVRVALEERNFSSDS